MNLEHILDHAARGLYKIALPFWEAVRFKAFLSAILDEVQEIEDAFHQIVACRDVDTTDLVRLRMLGRIVGAVRGNLDTESFRAAVRARLAVNRSLGRPSNLSNVFELLLGETGTWQSIELGPCCVLTTVYGTVPDDALLTEYSQDAVPAGVQSAVIRYATGATPFRWDSAYAPFGDGREGYASAWVHVRDGGVFARALS